LQGSGNLGGEKLEPIGGALRLVQSELGKAVAIVDITACPRARRRRSAGSKARPLVISARCGTFNDCSRYWTAVKVIKTHRPGYVVYEDEFQIAAYPFSDTPT
jgi:hypothetical protein